MKPNESYPLEFNFSCNEEYNNKFLKVGKEFIKEFCYDLIKAKFLAQNNQSEVKMVKLLLISKDSNEKIPVILNDLMTRSQTQIKLQTETFILGVYQNFLLKERQLVLYLLKNIIHENKNYALIDNQTSSSFSLNSSSFFIGEQLKLDQICPFSTHLVFFDEKINCKNFKTVDKNANISSFNINLISFLFLKYFSIRAKNSENVYFQIIIPRFALKIILEQGNDISIDMEIHVRVFQYDKFDILINKFKVILIIIKVNIYCKDREKLKKQHL